MNPPLTTIHIEPRIEFYGPIFVEAFCKIVSAVRTHYPEAVINTSDLYNNMLVRIVLNPENPKSQERNPAECPNESSSSGKI
jgi:hypothetical protein